MKSRRRKGKQLSFSFLKQKCLSPLLKQVEEHRLSCPEHVDSTSGCGVASGRLDSLFCA